MKFDTNPFKEEIDKNKEELFKKIHELNGWEKTPTLENNIKSLVEMQVQVREEKNVITEFNSILLQDYEIMNGDFFPTGGLTVWLLNACFKTPRECVGYLNNVLGQSAGQKRDLVEKGFVFKNDNPGKGGDVIRINGKQGREIIGIDLEIIHNNDKWINLPSKISEKVKKIFNEDMLGSIPHKDKKEFDHRIPFSVRRRFSIPTSPLTRKEIKDGSWIKDFQVISKKTNCLKREICNKCLNDEKIYLPGAFTFLRPYYISYRDEDENGCLGCFWYDYTKPKNIHLMPKEIIEELCNERKKLYEKVEKAKNIKGL